MAGFPVPSNLVQSAARDSFAERRDWIGELPQTVAGLAERWSLRLGGPFEPGGQCAWVAPAQDRSGRDLVLKVAWRHTEALHEADGLAVWAGNGTVAVYKAEAYAQTSALLLERCRPGTSLDQVISEPDQDVVVAGLLKRLWQPPPDGHEFRPLQQMCAEWAAEFDDKLAAAPASIDPGLARAGMQLFRTLPQTAPAEVLLCTDLHAENILSAQREPWLVIDPKPYVGDPTYDPLQHMLNCTGRLLTDPVRFARRMADLLELDAERLVRWLFARCVQESLDQPHLRDVATRLAPR